MVFSGTNQTAGKMANRDTRSQGTVDSAVWPVEIYLCGGAWLSFFSSSSSSSYSLGSDVSISVQPDPEKRQKSKNSPVRRSREQKEKETKANTVQQGKGKVNAGQVGQASSITLCKMDVGCAWLYTEHRASISE
ncbi:hypothetical protein H112_07716 [Trichophyton rubrum D6]|uniref:Uncharacterized protein n=3 Tax=Trichophyton TaxID=5550 RepID=F2SF49_TRIRC|nr:uncharacterized protein TERG_00316 [Trichophyton rubrum CBS 118892]EZF11128.1 hypothetical protein H100_07740 [Trichophyton rubrum MR850]EZF37992.1 hypothetical protein H102_07705 [Trichophyton rubrum CBS 100081]EZF48627.1 hypothetical protein H103_07728 [Trichophyton rubrum CBS 288.86]EZF59313.1 hypothetical protein H104_07677 [Trichophyton rubrum CBS 289.86]EZF69881.1 hypothetical protein H105_07732 [Trichophyton soudanense CBS 452.61]EZF80504.1 hypothetical protein H110_07726 [Trichophy